MAAVFAVSIPIPVSHAEESVLELQAQYDKLEAEIQKNQQKLREAEKDQSDQKAVVRQIDQEISGLSSQITILNKKIDLLNEEISGLNSSIQTLDQDIDIMNSQILQTKVNIAESQNQIDATYQKILDRFSKSYMAGTASSLELLLGAKSLTDVLTWQQYIQNATDYDNHMIEDLNGNITALQDMQTQLDAAVSEMEEKQQEAKKQKEDLELKQEDVTTSADELNVKKNTANSKRNEAYSLLRTMNSETEEFKILDEKMRAEEERIDAEMNARLAKIASVQPDPVPVATAATTVLVTTTAAPTTTAVAEDPERPDGEEGVTENAIDNPDETKESTAAATTTETTTQAQTIPASGATAYSPKDRHLICPIQNPHAVVSGTYPNYQSGGVHHGIDIVVTDQGKTYGHDIVAPQSGKVITIGYGDASRGNYFEIDHGEGLVTRYYHCSALLISLGQTVTQGQVIAKVGDTGNATGPHLHFEVLLNTTSGLIRQNPLSYISVP